MLDFVEEAFDEIALAIEHEITVALHLAVGLWRDHWNDCPPIECVYQRIGVVEKGDDVFEPLYTDEEFGRLLNLIPVQKFDEDHDAWLELMLACSHASTVDDGEDAFMKWTIKDGPGNRIGYGSDFDMILARWRYNYAKRNMKGGRQVGSFNRAVLAAAPGAKIKVPPQPTAEDDFGGDPVDYADMEQRIVTMDAETFVRQNYAVINGKLVKVPKRRW